MYESFKHPKAKILIGVQFDDKLPALLTYAKHFAKLFKARLRLTHVSDVFNAYPWSQLYPSGYVSPTLIKAMEEQAEEEAQNKMRQVVNEHFANDPVQPETQCLTGLVADSLDADARLSRSSLVMVAVKERSYKLMPRGFSTVLSLMAHSKVPVMVIPAEAKPPQEGTPLKLLFCDDLKPHSQAGIGLALDIIAGISYGELHHVHFHEKDQSDVEAMAQDIQQMMSMGRIPFDDKFSSAKLVDQIKAYIEQKMLGRLGDAKLIVEENGGTYFNRIYFGDVADQLTRCIEEVNPDLVIFGRHELVHRKPLGIGKLPFYAMLNVGKPIIVAPPHQ
jgi:nucleotide-binding universal stress UspA family protein